MIFIAVSRVKEILRIKNLSDSNNKKINFLDKIIIILLLFSIIFIIYKCVDYSLNKKFDPIVPREYRKEIYNLNKGKWILLDDEMSNSRATSFLHMLPDNNVLILGDGIELANYADVFDPNENKITSRILLNDHKCGGYNSTSLANGDVLIFGGRACLFDINKKLYFQNLLTTDFFDGKTYKFSKVAQLKEHKLWNNSLLLNNGHILLLPSIEKKVDTHLIYNPEKNEYYKANSNIKPYGNKFFKLENGDVIIFNPANFNHIKNTNNFIYKLKENKFETYDYLPVERTIIQLDNENYLTIGFTPKETIGAVYNIKTKKLIFVKNQINKTRKPTIIDPTLTLLKNGNVLILGINSKDYNQDYKKIDEDSAYIYDRQKNIFYEISSIPYPLHSSSSIMLNDGSILFAGGLIKGKSSNKLYIYKY